MSQHFVPLRMSLLGTVIQGPGAYEAAVANGFEGTIEEWFLTMQAPDIPGRYVHTVESLEVLQATDPQHKAVFLLGYEEIADQGRGLFVFVPGDQSANVLADPDQQNWIRPAYQTGSEGAWLRVTTPEGFNEDDLLPEAPDDGKKYARQSKGWSELVIPAPGISEAPNNGKKYLRQSTAWSEFDPASLVPPIPFQVNMQAIPALGEDDKIYVPLTSDVTFPINFAGSVFHVINPPGATANLILRKGATQVGTITVTSAGVVTLTTTGSAAVAFSAGEVFILDPGASPDPDLTFAVAFKGDR